MKRALLLIGALLAFALLLAGVGALLPVEHTARVRLALEAPPAAVYDVVADVAAYPSWRSGLDSLRLVSTAPRLRWRESGSTGTVEFEQTSALPGQLVRAEIQGAKEQGFGGTWTWELLPGANGGTTLTITEQGAVWNPLFRLLSRYLFSPYTSLERYGNDLAAHLGESVRPERLTP